MYEEIVQLVNTVKTHKALNNDFYRQWMTKQLTLPQIAVFAANYGELTFRFPEVLAILIANIDDNTARAEYTKTLYSEMGNGDPQTIHSVLFENFCNDLALYSGNPKFLTKENLIKNFPILPETISLISGEKTLYSKSHAIATGAQLALEWQAYTMIRQLYEGARNYISLWPNQDSFHESCEFFYVHIGSTEKEHKLEALNAANKIVLSKVDFEQLQYGFNTHLDLIADFWNAISKSTQTYSNT